MRYRGVTGRKKYCVRRFLKEPFFVNKINQSINHAGETQMPISHLPHSSLSYSESLGPSSLSLTSRATRLARILATSLSPITNSGHIVFPVTLTSRATRIARIPVLATSLSPITYIGHIVFSVTLTSRATRLARILSPIT